MCVCCAVVCALLLLSIGALVSFAEGGEEPASFLTVLGNNIWYILLVIAFGVGILLISKWSQKIKVRDDQFKSEYEEYKAEQTGSGTRRAKPPTTPATPKKPQILLPIRRLKKRKKNYNHTVIRHKNRCGTPCVRIGLFLCAHRLRQAFSFMRATLCA